MQLSNSSQFDTLIKQINQTKETIKILSDRKSYLISKIEAMNHGDENS